MKLPDPPAFDTPDAAARLAVLPEAEFDGLPYGVVEMDHATTVRRYNATESRFSGLSPSRVVGRHFFREVAPCSDNRHVARRYDAGSLDETIAYTFALRMRPVPVTLRMIKPAGGELMYLLVQWS
jgi:photoactive yellow protein